MKRFLHRVGAVLGPVLTVGGALTDVLPGPASKTVAIVIGTVATLLANLQRAFGTEPQTSEDITSRLKGK